MNKTLLIAVVAALTGCSTFQDPAAAPADVKDCKQVAHQDAHDNTPWAEVILEGPMIAHRLRQHDSFEACMAARGYRTAKQ